MKLPQRVHYGLVFLLQLHFSHPDFVPVKELAEAESMPHKFLEAIATDLKNEGLVEVKRGVRGGCRLARPLKGVTLMDVIRCLAPEWEGQVGPAVNASQGSKTECVSLFLGNAAGKVVKHFEEVRLSGLLALYNEDRSLLYYI